MKQFIILASALLISSIGFADGLSRNSAQLKALNSAWQTPHSNLHTQGKDITIVYGGQDIISDNPTLTANTTTA